MYSLHEYLLNTFFVCGKNITKTKTVSILALVSSNIQSETLWKLKPVRNHIVLLFII